MLIFGDRFVKLREKYIFPLINYKIKYGKLQFNNIKNVLVSKPINFCEVGNGKYIIYFNKEDILKGLLGDIEYFYTRAFIQYCNLKKSERLLSPCWNVVTQYYFNYFSATTILRLLYRGNLYLDSNQSSKVSDIATALIREKIKLRDGNYTFNICDDIYTNGDGELITNSSQMCLYLNYTASKGTHEQTWISIDELLNELLKNNKKDDEYTVLKTLKDISNIYNCKFPSTMRNTVNYQAPYGYKTLQNVLKCGYLVDNPQKWLKELLEFNASQDENYKIKVSQMYGYYFFVLATKLYDEYKTRTKIDKKFNEDKTDYLTRLNLDMPSYMDNI